MRLWPSGGLWRHADFLRLWSAETISQVGTQVSQLALPLTAILVLDASAFEVALLGAAPVPPVPPLHAARRRLGRPAPATADPRRRRHPAGILLVSVPIAYALDALSIWQLYVVAFGVGIGTVFFDVAYQSYLPSLVRQDQLVDGNSKLEISRAGAFIAGPGMAGVLVGALTAPFAVLVDALSFFGSAGFLARIRATRGAAGANRGRTPRPRAPGGASLPRLPPLLEAVRDVHGDVQLLRPGRGLDLPRVRRPGARPVPAADRAHARAGRRRRHRGSRARGEGLEAVRRRPDDRRCSRRLRARRSPDPARAGRGTRCRS